MGGTVETKVPRFIFRYRNTPQSTTGLSPAEMLLGRRPHSHLDLMHPDIGQRVHQRQQKQVESHSVHAKDRTLRVGDTMYVMRTGKTKWFRGVIVEQTGPVSFRVRLDDGRVVRRHVAHVRSQLPPELPIELPPELPVELPPELPIELPPELPVELPPELPIELPPELPVELPPELPIELPPELPVELPPELPVELPPELPVELPPEPHEPVQADPPEITQPEIESPHTLGQNGIFEGVLTRYRLTETKLTDVWTLFTMGQHYNCCWPTSQRRVDNFGNNFESWIGRHDPRDDVELYTQQIITRLPEVTREGTARLGVSYSRLPAGRDAHYSEVPHACFRFDRPLLWLQTTRRVGMPSSCLGRFQARARRSRSTDHQMSPATLTPTRANVPRNIHRRRRTRRWFSNYPTPSDTSIPWP
ncbi:hypothetical protein LSAT2_001793 [Lamellibrachia satsuma]|nr:hypothetical protein LSAT2_001793 [Lamellibrachia satsuma]